jgi:hypothetical protein
MPDDLSGFRLVGGDITDGSSARTDAAIGHVHQPIAEQIDASVDPVGPEAA